MKSNFIGKYVIVRGDRSGVFAGILQEREGGEVRLTDCRHLYYWDGALETSQIAHSGVNTEDCTFSSAVAEIEILDVVEVIPCTEAAEKTIRSVAEWRQ